MKRLLSTTALVIAMTGAAHAQSDGEGLGQVEMQQSDFYASDLIGMRIYNSEQEVSADTTIADGGEAEWEDIGEINDIIVTKDGQVSGVILGVGGFLGMGEHDVAVPMNKITVVREEGDSGDRFLVVSTTKEELEQMPAVEKKDGASADKSDTEQQAATDQQSQDQQSDDQQAQDQMSDDANQQKSDDTDKSKDQSEAEMSDDTTTTVVTTDGSEDTAEQGDTQVQQDDQTMEQTEAETTEAEADAMAPAAVERDMLPRPTVEREGYTEVQMEEATQMTSEELEGTPVYGANDESVGEIDSLIVEDGKVSRVVVNVGGFLGLGEKPVAVTFDELQILKQEGGDDLRVYIDSTEERLEAQPEYEN